MLEASASAIGNMSTAEALLDKVKSNERIRKEMASIKKEARERAKKVANWLLGDKHGPAALNPKSAPVADKRAGMLAAFGGPAMAHRGLSILGDLGRGLQVVSRRRDNDAEDQVAVALGQVLKFGQEQPRRQSSCPAHHDYDQHGNAATGGDAAGNT